MQLHGATKLELRLYELCIRVEREMAAGELETAIVSGLSDAAEELQRLRGVGTYVENTPPKPIPLFPLEKPDGYEDPLVPAGSSIMYFCR